MQAGTDFGAPPVVREIPILVQNHSAPLVRSKTPWLCPLESLWGESNNFTAPVADPAFEPETVNGCIPVQDQIEIDYYPSFGEGTTSGWWREEPTNGVMGQQEYGALPCRIAEYGQFYVTRFTSKPRFSGY